MSEIEDIDPKDIPERAAAWAEKYAALMNENADALEARGVGNVYRPEPPDWTLLWSEWWDHHDHYEGSLSHPFPCNGIGCLTCMYAYTIVRAAQEIERLGRREA